MRYPTREYQCANRRRTLPLGQAFNLIATRVLDSVVHINGCECDTWLMVHTGACAEPIQDIGLRSNIRVIKAARVGISSKIHDPVIRFGSERLLRDLLASTDESNDGKNSNYGGCNRCE